jgi:hypothetical protein
LHTPPPPFFAPFSAVVPLTLIHRHRFPYRTEVPPPYRHLVVPNSPISQPTTLQRCSRC